MRESEFSHRAARGVAAAARRLRGAVLRLGRHAVRPGGADRAAVAGAGGGAASIVVGKSVAACALVLLLRYPLGTALTVSASLAQIGEFSFILAALGGSLGPAAAGGPEPAAGRGADLDRHQSAVVQPDRAAAAVAARRIRPCARARRRATIRWPSCRCTPRPEYLSRQVVLVGYGRVGRRIAAGAGGQRHSVRGGRAEPRHRRAAARRGHGRGVGRRGRSRRC